MKQKQKDFLGKLAMAVAGMLVFSAGINFFIVPADLYNGGMLGISKESWMAALEKENYLKAAEMSMEDDYGMIDGIINNGPKEDKTLDAKAPERGEKSSIMDRLKSAKAEKQKECCPPQKHKGEIEL